MNRFWDMLLKVIIVLFVIAIVTKFIPRDDTDPPDGRSGMGLRIDHRTGCHYLTSTSLLGETAITPRLDSTGRQVCNQPGGSDNE